MGLMKEAIADVTQIRGLIAERNRMASVIETLEQTWRNASATDMHKVYQVIHDVQGGSSLMDAVEAMYGSK